MKGLLLALALIASACPASAAPSPHTATGAADHGGKQEIDNPARASTRQKENGAKADARPDDEEAKREDHSGTELKAANAAADSADAAWATFYAGIGIGGATLISAIFAAYFAGRAAHHARKNIDAIYEAERGILHAQDAVSSLEIESGEQMICIAVLNRGRTTARVIEIGTLDGPQGRVVNRVPRWVWIAPGQKEPVPAFPPPEKTRPAKYNCWISYRSAGPKIYTSYFTLIMNWREGTHSTGLAMLNGWYIMVANTNGHPEDT